MSNNFTLAEFGQRAGVFSNKNYIINGNFDIWQRGTTLGSGSGGRYLADRWLIGSGGSTYTAARQPFTTGQNAVPNNPTYYHSINVTSVAGAANYCLMQQFIENVRLSSGKTFTLSFWAKSNVNRTIAVEGYQTFGSGGTPSAAVYGDVVGYQKFNFTTSWQKFTMIINYPSISGKTIGSNDDSFFGFDFFFDSGSNYNARNGSIGQQSGIYDIAQVQLEEGNVATQFEFRHPQQEFILCQRYYQAHYAVLISGYVVAGGNTIYGDFPLPVTMRVTPPTPVFQNQSYSNANSFGLNVATQSHIRLQMVSVAGGSAWGVSDVILSAELG